MKINSSTSRKKRIIIGLVLVVLLAIASYAAYSLYGPKTSDTSKSTDSEVNYDPATDEEIAGGNTAKEETIKENDSTKDGQVDSPKQSISQQITTTSVSDGTLYVRNEIAGVYSSGACTLTLGQGSRSIVKKSGVQPLAATSTCKGFNVPVSELTKGTWSVILTVTVDGKTADDVAEIQI